MAYNASYTTADLSEATIDGGAVFIITLVSLAGIISLVLIGKYAYRSWKNR